MDERLEALKSFYAHYVAAVAETPELRQRLSEAFQMVARERFLDDGPWRVLTPTGYIQSPTADPIVLYQDIVVALSHDGPLNNGEPSLHARCLASVNPAGGETVLHIGAGTGYYTAILATLVGRSGRVIAYEIDQGLATRAVGNLANFLNVIVHPRSGSEGPLPNADVVYVNAGATAPLDIWLDALRPQGRLVCPLTPAYGLGAVFRITRVSSHQFSATAVSPAMFVPCAGGRDERAAVMLAAAFDRGGTEHVKSLHRNNAPDDTCWFAGNGWWLSTAAVG